MAAFTSRTSLAGQGSIRISVHCPGIGYAFRKRFSVGYCSLFGKQVWAFKRTVGSIPISSAMEYSHRNTELILKKACIHCGHEVYLVWGGTLEARWEQIFFTTDRWSSICACDELDVDLPLWFVVC